ncbi:hypothetical protein ASF71_20575 [Deinococcus sp. Leaf326]|nr:hypothetical protein ASF71_20575 [Deinococcus sp. Leaf326]
MRSKRYSSKEEREWIIQIFSADSDEFDAVYRIVDAYPAALLWALACAVEQRLGALPGSEREHEAVFARNSA